jgi:hypothetical protein
VNAVGSDGPMDPRLIAKELQLTASSRQRTLYFHGESMRPFLVEGDEVVVAPVDWEKVRIGDVITYRLDEKFPTRRLIRRLGEDIELFCENWPNRYFRARREDVLGQAIARGRAGEWLTINDREWRAARRSALRVYRLRVAVPRAMSRVRGAVGRFLRWTGLRRSRPARDRIRS